MATPDKKVKKELATISPALQKRAETAITQMLDLINDSALVEQAKALGGELPSNDEQGLDEVLGELKELGKIPKEQLAQDLLNEDLLTSLEETIAMCEESRKELVRVIGEQESNSSAAPVFSTKHKRSKH